jgi:hypothetical protein
MQLRLWMIYEYFTRILRIITPKITLNIEKFVIDFKQNQL